MPGTQSALGFLDAAVAGGILAVFRCLASTRRMRLQMGKGHPPATPKLTLGYSRLCSPPFSSRKQNQEPLLLCGGGTHTQGRVGVRRRSHAGSYPPVAYGWAMASLPRDPNWCTAASFRKAMVMQ